MVSLNSLLVISDAWRSYNGLGAIGYNHKVVVHERNFVAPEVYV